MRALLATSRAAFAEVFANRASLVAQATTMVVNDVIWVVFWVLFFHRVGTLGGWDTHRILLLQAVLTASGGLVLGLLGNARRLGTMAADGALDAALSLPVPPLPYLLLRKVEAVNLGDLVFGVGLFVAVGHPTPLRIATFVLVVLASATLLASFLVLTASLAFFAGQGETGELGFHAILLLAAYPVDVFAGNVRLLLFTVVPAAFITAVPARLLFHLDAGRAVGLAGSAGIFAALAVTAFHAGLRRYASGSVWTRA
jgi:ABC-2 type transport system permease protein